VETLAADSAAVHTLVEEDESSGRLIVLGSPQVHRHLSARFGDKAR
jgi:hypothetical protein